ncbi:MAG: metallophosphoesterase family protein [Phycisphaerae bacterium]|jgi:predicted phosphodiesterase|nr:metallophosphoesterase family protein [Phycisphaerae bacterium]
MIAIISDIHSNTAALTAVLDDISERKVDRVICLGDVVGYGPDPCGCIDLVMERCCTTVLGNHDCAVTYEPSNFNVGAESACYWTRWALENSSDPDKRAARWDFLGNLSVKETFDASDLDLGNLELVHGSPRRPVNEYIFPDDIYNNPNKIRGLFERIERLCFVGHTHVPGVFLDTPDFYSPEELEWAFEVDPKRKAIINVGSVGQPRDSDPRAGYVLVESGAVRFVRVPYDVDETVEKVYAIAELDDYLGTRLKKGR